CAACIKDKGRTRSSSTDAFCFCGTENEAYQFFNNCLVPVIKLCDNAERRAAANKAQKELIPLFDMISPVNRFVKIGIIPLNERKDRFLCIYTDLREIETQILV
ncbi:MAG: hypothetical protein ACRD8W_25620, partial [Nitrososphaeraceae archaeon]